MAIIDFSPEGLKIFKKKVGGALPIGSRVPNPPVQETGEGLLDRARRLTLQKRPELEAPNINKSSLLGRANDVIVEKVPELTVPLEARGALFQKVVDAPILSPTVREPVSSNQLSPAPVQKEAPVPIKGNKTQNQFQSGEALSFLDSLSFEDRLALRNILNSNLGARVNILR